MPNQVVEKDLVCTVSDETLRSCGRGTATDWRPRQVLVEHSYLTIERVRPGDGATFPEKGQIVSVSAREAAAARGGED